MTPNTPSGTAERMTETETTTAIETRRLGLFFGTLVVLIGGFTAVSWGTGVDIVSIGVLYMFTPMIAGLVVCLTSGISLSDVGVRVGRPGWLALAAVLSFPLVAGILVLSIGVPGVAFDSTIDLAAELGLPSGTVWTVAALGVLLLAGVTINAVPALGEEFGWRGYLLWELAPIGFWKASLLIGAVWGVWHAPLIVAGHNYPSFPIVGIAAMTIACIAMSPLYTYVVVRAKSVLAAALLHGVFNATGGLFAIAATDDAVLRELVASPVGVIGIVVFSLVAVWIAVVETPTLTREFATVGRPS